jgi:tripartite-type tricarboxylate transporter receptor subunit TctC
MRHQHGIFVLIVLVATCCSAPARTPSGDATNYPERMVHVIVPFSAGSMTDIMARTIADHLTTRWNPQVIVENRPGLAGSASVAKDDAPQGYMATLCCQISAHTAKRKTAT